MELSPRFEALPRREMPPALSARDLFAIPPYPPAPAGGAPAWLVAPLGARGLDGASSPGPARFPWRVRMRDGVLEAIDPVAFLDRAQWISPVPTLRVRADPGGGARRRPDRPFRHAAPRLGAAGAGRDGVGGRRRARRRLPRRARRAVRRAAADRAPSWPPCPRPTGRPSGATRSVRKARTIAVAGGTLSLAASRWGAEYGYAHPVAPRRGPVGPVPGARCATARARSTRAARSTADYRAGAGGRGGGRERSVAAPGSPAPAPASRRPVRGVGLGLDRIRPLRGDHDGEAPHQHGEDQDPRRFGRWAHRVESYPNETFVSAPERSRTPHRGHVPSP